MENSGGATKFPAGTLPGGLISRKPGKKWYKKPACLICIIILVLVFVSFIVMMIAGTVMRRGGSENGSASGNGKTTSAPVAKTTAKMTAKPSPTKGPTAPAKPTSTGHQKPKREDRFKRFFPYPDANHPNIAIPTAGSYDDNGKISIYDHASPTSALPTATSTSHSHPKATPRTADKIVMPKGRSNCTDASHNGKNMTHTPGNGSPQNGSAVNGTAGYKPLILPDKPIELNATATGTPKYVSAGASSYNVSVAVVSVVVLVTSFVALMM